MKSMNRVAAGPLRTVAVAASLLSLTACGGNLALTLGGGSNQPPTALLVGFHRGETLRFQFNEELKGELVGGGRDVNDTIDVNGIYDVSVLGFDKQKDMSVDFFLEKASGKENGKALKLPEVGKHFQLLIAPDGSLKKGDELSTQASNSEASSELPGSDQWTPLTPGDKKVSPGDSWNTSYDRPFGDGIIHEDDTTQFMRWEKLHGKNTAVLQTDYSVPGLDVSESLRSLFEKCGCHLPPDINPRLHFGGKLSGTETDWLDPKSNDLLKSDSTGFFDVTVGLRDFPESVTPNGDFRFNGSDHIVVESLKISAPGTIL